MKIFELLFLLFVVYIIPILKETYEPTRRLCLLPRDEWLDTKVGILISQCSNFFGDVGIKEKEEKRWFVTNK